MIKNYLREGNISKPRFDGFYKALVEDNVDPENKGRVRVRVFPFFFDLQEEDDIPKDDLPWAQPCWWWGDEPSKPSVVPQTGSWVWVFFEQGDPMYPVYIGYAIPIKKIETINF